MSKLHTLLRKRNLTVTCAESCTGGLIAKLLTDPAGASAVFRGSFVTYCNDLKADLLGVRPETLDRFGPVSPETACEMAVGALSRVGADVAVSATGVAGPGESEGKPVGTVCIAVALRREVLPAPEAPACRNSHTETPNASKCPRADSRAAPASDCPSDAPLRQEASNAPVSGCSSNAPLRREVLGGDAVDCPSDPLRREASNAPASGCPSGDPVCVWVKTYHFDGTRAMNRQFAARAALQLAQTALESPASLGDPFQTPAD